MSGKIVYSRSKTGKLLVWSAVLDTVPNNDGFLEITITSGQDTGKKVDKVRYVKSGMNIGRSNETSLHEQAQLELERLYKKQYEKGYVDNADDACVTKQVGTVKKPTLASKYPDKAHKLPSNNEHIITQPKIDGIRCFITKLDDGTMSFTSRSGKPIPSVEVISNAIAPHLPVGDIVDGELYIEGYELQDIISVVLPKKNKKLDQLAKVKLYWYDYIPRDGEHLSYKERFLDNTLSFAPAVEKLRCDSYELTTLEERFDEYMNAGYEGLMLRDTTAPYYFGRRTTSLQKYKKMQTDEFQIIDIIESPQDDTPRIVCDLRNGNTVTVRLTGDKEQNLEYLTNKELYIGKWLTIKYQVWTKTGSLQFPVGVTIRDGEYINGEFVPSV